LRLIFTHKQTASGMVHNCSLKPVAGIFDWRLLLRALPLGFLFVLLAFGHSAYGAGSGNVRIGDIRGKADLTGYMTVLEDPGRSMTLESILNPAAAQSFVPYEAAGVSGSLSKSAYWIQFQVENTEGVMKQMILELEKPHLNYVSFYELDEEGKLLREMQAGRAAPFEERAIKHRNFIFPLTLPSDAVRQIYVRVQTDSYVQVPLILWEDGSFAGKEQHGNLALGLFYGVMLVMAAFNFFLYLMIKERAYLYYVMLLVSFTLLQSVWDGLAYQYLWPGYPGWEAVSNPVILTAVSASALLFTHSFLSVSRYSKRVGAVNRVAVGVLFAAVPAMLFLDPSVSTRSATYLVGAGMLLCVASVCAVRFRTRYAYYYCISWLLLLAGSLLNLLAAYKALPLNAVTLYAPRIGMAAEAVLLALALADRYNGMKKAKQLEEKLGSMLKDLHDVTKKLTVTYDLNELCEYTLERLGKITDFESGCILIKSEEGFTMKAASGEFQAQAERALTKQEPEQFLQELHRREPNEGIFDGLVLCRAAGIKAETALGIPVVYQSRWLGVILLTSVHSRMLRDSERAILGDFASQVGISIENARLFHEINRMATTDGLTGACNRTHFLQLAEAGFKQCLDNRIPLSMVMVDIDNFKQINDRFGHLAGDKVIQQLVYSLNQIMDSSGKTGRYGGEEFIVMLPGLNKERACVLAESLREHIRKLSVSVGENGVVRFTISVGVAEISEETGSIEELINQADSALYRAKESGRNRVELYEGPLYDTDAG
jgi:two-component system, sensor histidine kinase LadS